MGETSDSPTIVLPDAMELESKYHLSRNPPGSGSYTRNSILRGNFALVDRYLRELASVFVPLQRVCTDSRDVDFSTEIARKVTEMRSLFDNGTRTDRATFQN